ncbi:MAG: hypothetical protein KIT34_17930 [Cyanobacteria bacterium TGS_CYA1]|nr:hypothetical protein [Cyanobacteria bacterium TGS_CYA1]
MPPAQVCFTIIGDYSGGTIEVEGSVTATDDMLIRGWSCDITGENFDVDGNLTTDANTTIDMSGSINVEGDVTTLRDVNLLFTSEGDIGTGNITIDNTDAYQAGRLAIKANREGGSSKFTIGGSSESNGVNGQITTNATTGGGSETSSLWYGGVYIMNGGDGGIKLNDMTAISVSASQSKSGGIILDAQDGELEMPTGTLSVDGTGSYAGASILLRGDTISTEDGTTLSASDNGSAGAQKVITLCANKIEMTGSSGLTVNVEGDANATYYNAIQIVPFDAVEVMDTGNAVGLYIWLSMPNGPFGTDGAVEIDGGASAPLHLSCNGDHSHIELSGNPLTFAGGEVTIEAKGDVDHKIDFAIYGSPVANSLQFNCDDVTIDASGDDGDGGDITFFMPGALRDDTGNITVKADGDGEGKGGTITFYPGDVDLVFGTDPEQWAFSAKGGDTSGDGGEINIYGYESAVEVTGAGPGTTVLDVSVPGSDGNGGTLNLVAYGGLTFDGSDSILKADGGSSSGDGGTIQIQTSEEEISISTGDSGDVQFSAKANGGDGSGGTVDITSYSGITAEATSIDVSADGTGTGGNISLNAGYSTLNLESVEFSADGGSGGGNGGLLHMEGGEITVVPEENTVLRANGLGSGDGGNVEVVTQWGAIDIGGDDEEISIEAQAEEESFASRSTFVNGYGNGGRTFVWQANHFKTSGTAIKVRAFQDGHGGTIDIQCTDYIWIDANLTADGSGSGKGGDIKLDAPTIKLRNDRVLSALGGDSNGAGGKIEILSTNDVQFVDAGGSPSTSPAGLMFKAQATGTGEGGEVKISNIGAFAVNTVINVNGGNVADTSTFYGSIELNGVKCRQRKRGSGDIASLVWPKTYWDGVNHSSSTPSTVADDALTGALTIPNDHGLRDLLNGQNVHLYAMSVFDDYLDFFAQPTPMTGTDGVFGISLHGSTKASNVFANVNVSGSPVSAVTASGGKTTIMKGTAVHELAHRLDVLCWSGDSQLTGSGTFGEAISLDVTTMSAGYINYESCSTVWGGTICGSHPGLTNSQILGVKYKGTAYELYAQVFEHLIGNWVHSDLEQALGFLPKQIEYIQDVINAGHP